MYTYTIYQIVPISVADPEFLPGGGGGGRHFEPTSKTKNKKTPPYFPPEQSDKQNKRRKNVITSCSWAQALTNTIKKKSYPICWGGGGEQAHA